MKIIIKIIKRIFVRKSVREFWYEKELVTIITYRGIL